MTQEENIVRYNIKVPLNAFEIMQTIGIGSYGKVCLCKYKKNQKPYVIKMLNKSEIIRTKQVDHVFNEYNILSFVNHPFIAELKGVNVKDPKYLYFFLEYIPGGELFSILRKNRTFPIEQTKFYLAHIIIIFEYLHSKNIIYRDLKPENILIKENGYIKLTDFGYAKILDVASKTFTLCGTPGYLAPEIILNKGHNKAVDWWTVGIFLYELLVGIDPFNDDDPMQIYQNIVKGKIIFPTNINKKAKSLIKHLLVSDISKRYGCLKGGVKDIIEHNFFHGFDWRGLIMQKIEAPYIPEVKGKFDTSNYHESKDNAFEENEGVNINIDKDPFLDW